MVHSILQRKNQEKYTIVKRAQQDLWEKFTADIEYGVSGKQTLAYKLMKSLNSSLRKKLKSM